MQTLASDGPVVPVIINDPDGTMIAAALQNTKASRKSLEQGALWIVDGSTGRVLPWPAGGKLESISEGPRANTAVVSAAQLELLDQPATPAETASNAPEEAEGSATVPVLEALEALIKERQAAMPEGSYTTHLFKAGPGKIRKKTGEEAIELILADSTQTMSDEAADLLYHMTVLFVASGLSWRTVLDTLARR